MRKVRVCLWLLTFALFWGGVRAGERCRFVPCPPAEKLPQKGVEAEGRYPPLPNEGLLPEERGEEFVPWREWATAPELWTVLGLRGYSVMGLKRPKGCRLRGGEGVLEAGLLFRKPHFFSEKWTLEGYALLKGGLYDFIHDEHRTLFLDLKEFKLILEDPLLRLPFKWTVTIGRQYVAEDTGQWYRNYLDALRVDYQKGRWGAYFIGATRFEDYRVSNSEESVDLKHHFYALGRIYYRDWFKGFWGELLYERTNPDRKRHYPFYESVVPDNRLLWLNLSGRMRWASGLEAWAVFSKLWGRTEDVKTAMRRSCSGERLVVDNDRIWADGYLWELGLKYKDEVKGLGLVVLRAGGDDLYVQPRLANNRRILFGWERFRAFGDLLHPRLQNLFLWGLFGGVKLPRVFKGEAWLEALFMDYARLEDKRPLRISRYTAGSLDRNGEHLGDELDVMLEWRKRAPSRKLFFRLVGAYFWPGEAFYSDKPAYKIYFSVRWFFRHDL